MKKMLLILSISIALHSQNEMQHQTDIMMLTKYGFPMQSDYEERSVFNSAFDEISNMLSGQETLNLGRVVFLVENAWHNNKIDYNDYQKGIKSGIEFCNQKIKEEKQDRTDNLVKNMMLFRFMCDTLTLKDKVRKQRTLSMNESGKVSYAMNEGVKKLKGDAKHMAGMINDGGIIVNLITTDKYETSTANLMTGGAFMGNAVTTDTDENETQDIKQVVKAEWSVSRNVKSKVIQTLK